MQATLKASNGVLRLPLIKNKKTVNPRDSSTPAVFQLETAMGSAIECFDDAGAVVVPRERFAPVKTANDLFVLRSDAYKVRLLLTATFFSQSHALEQAGRYRMYVVGQKHETSAGRHPMIELCSMASSFTLCV